MVRYHVSALPQLGRFRNEMDRLLSDFLGRSAGLAEIDETSRGFPAVNVWQQDDEVFVEAEVPGHLGLGEVGDRQHQRHPRRELPQQQLVPGPEPEAERTRHGVDGGVVHGDDLPPFQQRACRREAEQ